MDAKLEFQNANLRRNYPLRDDGASALPTPLLVDGLISTSMPDRPLYITRLEVGASNATLYIGGQSGTEMADCA